jgi:hypothetical protein
MVLAHGWKKFAEAEALVDRTLALIIPKHFLLAPRYYDFGHLVRMDVRHLSHGHTISYLEVVQLSVKLGMDSDWFTPTRRFLCFLFFFTSKTHK